MVINVSEKQAQSLKIHILRGMSPTFDICEREKFMAIEGLMNLIYETVWADTKKDSLSPSDEMWEHLNILYDDLFREVMERKGRDFEVHYGEYKLQWKGDPYGAEVHTLHVEPKSRK